MGCNPWMIDQPGQKISKGGGDICSKGLSSARTKLLKNFAPMSRNRWIECSDCSLHDNLIGNDVGRMAPMHETDRNDNRIASVRSSWNRLINKCDELSRGGNRINCRMRPRRMTSPSTYQNRKILAERA